MEKKYWLEICKDVGEKTFSEVQKYIGKEERKNVMKTGFSGDKTLLIDHVAEKTIINALESTGRSFELISEEMGKKTVGEKPEVQIVIDPLDGSNNFRFGIPFASASIAVGNLKEKMEGIEVGYVKNLINGDSYYAVKDEGAFKNGEKINTSEEEVGCVLIDIVLDRKKNFDRIKKLGGSFPYIRMLGSCCLGICFVAEGIVDSYVGLGRLRTIDDTATQLIVREAGGVVKDLKGKDFKKYKIGFDIENSLITASNEKMYKKIKSFLK